MRNRKTRTKRVATTKKEIMFFFELMYPHQYGANHRIFFSAIFPHPEAAIQWTIHQRKEIIKVHSAESPKDCRSVILRFLDKNETPPRWANVGNLGNPLDTHISQILALPCS